jgi:hypothetical protein
VLSQPKPNQKPAPLHDPAAQAALFNEGAAANRWPGAINSSGHDYEAARAKRNAASI